MKSKKYAVVDEDRCVACGACIHERPDWQSFAVAAGNKGFCNRYCGRGQLFTVLGKSTYVWEYAVLVCSERAQY